MLRSATAILLLLATGLGAQAQNKLPPRRGGVVPRPRAVIKPGAEIPKDGVMMKDGKIMLTEMGQTGLLTAERTLVNGTKISATGLITGRDGATTQLQEGDLVSLSGRITTRTALAEQDSSRKMLEYDTKMKSMTKQQRNQLKAKEKASQEKAERLAKKDKTKAQG